VRSPWLTEPIAERALDTGVRITPVEEAASHGLGRGARQHGDASLVARSADDAGAAGAGTATREHGQPALPAATRLPWPSAPWGGSDRWSTRLARSASPSRS
jgi:hypothetical protein